MQLSSNFIKKNQHFLKSCILYEVLQKKPIFDSYRNFCDTVGKDAMEYRDFEFWYYRFYQGELDFDYDRSADPEPKALVDMPVVLMKKITQKLDSIERARLRYINHAIKAVADSSPPVFENIEITLSKNVMQWTLNDKRFSCLKEGSGSILHTLNSSVAEKSDKFYMEKGTEHLAPLLKIPNIQVNYFSLDLLDQTLNLLPVAMNAKRVSILSRNTIEAIQFLSAMTPGYLQSICLYGMSSIKRENYSMIFETDQIKQAKSVNFPLSMEFNVEDFVHFSHLKSFRCYLKSENPFEDVPRIRDILSTLEDFESCELDYYGVSDGSSIRVFAMALGEEIPVEPLFEDGRMIITHRYRIPESNESLEFKLKDEGHNRCRVNIVKRR
ncbi:hypothetical protein B9Z55_027027 [Caenorhabditis nigoni]|uniref:F-box domain-containing protein n=1 Tax=Caenorhabditis nigoni TaxID=1611254 RepID=A0A2G5SIY0_9PELO|nr:hypothetical protein B9Z55_027027 [Caenorhabditis nigoni]